MNYAVNVEHGTTQQMKVTSRKRNSKFSLLYVEQGLVLVRLGKSEYAVEPNQSWWLPFDCLTSLTYLPNTRYTRIDISVRLKIDFTFQAGLVSLPPLAREALVRLTTTKRTDPFFQPLSEIIKLEAEAFQPQLVESPLGIAISNWKPSANEANATRQTSLSSDLQLALLIREASKLEQSGIKPTVVAERLFNGNLDQYQQLKQLLIAR